MSHLIETINGPFQWTTEDAPWVIANLYRAYVDDYTVGDPERFAQEIFCRFNVTGR